MTLPSPSVLLVPTGFVYSGTSTIGGFTGVKSWFTSSVPGIL